MACAEGVLAGKHGDVMAQADESHLANQSTGDLSIQDGASSTEMGTHYYLQRDGFVCRAGISNSDCNVERVDRLYSICV